jgi:hypothetical protein
MKNALLFALLFCLSLPLMAQDKKAKPKKINQKKPETVALEYYKALSLLDFQTAKSISTPEAQQMLSLLESLMTDISEEDKKKAIAEAKPKVKKLKKATCQINGELATCTVCCMDDQDGQEPVLLKKVDGKWYIHLDKGEPSEDGEPASEPGLIPQPDGQD